VVLGELTGGHGLRAAGLPPGTGELGLDLRGEHAQADDEQDPHHGGQAGVIGAPDPESTERSGPVAQVEVARGARAWRPGAVMVMAKLFLSTLLGAKGWSEEGG